MSHSNNDKEKIMRRLILLGRTSDPNMTAAQRRHAFLVLTFVALAAILFARWPCWRSRSKCPASLASSRGRSSAASMNVARSRHVGVLLNNGRVLVAGGRTATGVHTAASEIYDPSSGTWASTAAMSVGRDNFTGRFLPMVACWLAAA
jgi:hypothetical protein